MKIYDLEPLVLDVLIKNPIARCDNFVLYNEVLKHFIDTKMSLEEVFLNHSILRIPSLESITRCRRKIQEKDSTLKDEKTVEIRAEEEEKYRDYARGV